MENTNVTIDSGNYKNTLDTLISGLVLIDTLVSDENIKFLWDTLAYTEAMGPFIDPTKYRNAIESNTLEHQRKIVNVVKRIKLVMSELRTEVGID